MSAQLTTRMDHDLGQFQRRVQRRRRRFVTRPQLQTFFSSYQSAASKAVGTQMRHLPPRMVLHVLLALLVPLSLWLSTSQFGAVDWMAEGQAPVQVWTDPVLPLGPIVTEQSLQAREVPVSDSAFAEIIALPEGQANLLRNELLAPLTLPGTVQTDQATIRQGPGAEYDKIGELAAGTPLTLLSQYGDWFSAQLESGEQVWIAAELVQNAPVVQGILDVANEIPVPPPPKIATVGAQGLNVRDGPGTQYVPMSKVPAGTVIDLLSRYENWFEVQLSNGQVGWVTGDYLNIVPGVVERIDVLTNVPNPNPALVGSTGVPLNLRGGPGVEYNKLGTAGTGTSFDLLGRSNTWLKVQTPQGTVAWVSNEILAVDPYILRRVPVEQNIPALPRPAAPAAPAAQEPVGASARFSDNKPAEPIAPAAPVAPAPVPAANAGGVVSFAMQFVGTPYVWGGASPGGFDCSGFTKYVYGQFGLSLPHSADGQFNGRYGTIISDQGSLAPGDLVFFANTYKRGISHVGIYAGGGQVVQALAPGTGLSSVSMHSPYWQSRYYAGLRPNL